MRATWVAAAGLVLAASCERSEPGPGSAPVPVLAPADQTYTVRGRIERLPGAEGPMLVHHEAIPEFVGRDGRVVGMREMVMEFGTIATGVSLEGIGVGDAVAMTFEVRWKSDPRTLVTGLEKLPPGTELKFEGR